MRTMALWHQGYPNILGYSILMNNVTVSTWHEQSTWLGSKVFGWSSHHSDQTLSMVQPSLGLEAVFFLFAFFSSFLLCNRGRQTCWGNIPAIITGDKVHAILIVVGQQRKSADQSFWSGTQLTPAYKNKWIKVTVDLQGCLPKNHLYARRLCYNHRKVYITVKLIKCKIRRNKHF